MNKCEPEGAAFHDFCETGSSPFFITEEIETTLITAGYVFEPPGHFRTTSLADILAGLADDELAAWPDQLADQERERRGAFRR